MLAAGVFEAPRNFRIKACMTNTNWAASLDLEASLRAPCVELPFSQTFALHWKSILDKLGGTSIDFASLGRAFRHLEVFLVVLEA